MTYAATFDKAIPGLRFIDRSAEGFLDIVYDNGFDPAVQLYDCGPYVITITKDGTPFDTVSVANHFDQSCWWYDLVPVDSSSIINQPSWLIANGYVPPIGKTSIPLSAPSLGKDKFSGIMKLTPDVTGGEATTGGRPEIGIVTTNAAEWLMLGDARDMMEDAKDVATQPIWNYDNGKPIDLIAKPQATHNVRQPGLQIGPFPDAPTTAGAVLQPSVPDTGHMADLCGVVALATLAPRYVRALQMRVVRGFDEDAYWALQPSWGVVTIWNIQTRGTAWLFRSLFYCYWATFLAEQAGNLPSDCLPTSTFKAIIDNQATLFTKYIEPSPSFKNLAVLTYADAPNGHIIAWWQHDMLNQVLGLYAQKWPAVWGPIYIKFLRNLAARTNADGLKQWPVAMPTWYWGALSQNVNGKPVWYSSYSELWQKWSAGQVAGVDTSGDNQFIWLTKAQVAALNADTMNGGKFIKPTQYESWTYGAIAFAVYLDRAGPLKGAISAAYPNLEQAFTDYSAMMLNNYPFFIAPCSFSVTPQPPTTIPPPPVGALTMSLHTASIQIGQHIQLDLKVSPAGAKLATGPFYTSSDPAVADAVPDANGVLAGGLAEGTAKIIVTGTNPDGTTVAGECDLTVTAPFVQALDLVPGVVS